MDDIKLKRRPYKIVQSYEARALRKRPFANKVADDVTQFAGSIIFLLSNLAFFTLWITTNIGLIPGITPFDPYPFVMLTTIVSLEAIILTTIVLMSQNRQSVVSTLRDEIQLQVELLAERELTKVLEVLDKLIEKEKLKIDDEELHEMIKKTDISYIERQLEKELNPQLIENPKK